MKPGDQEKSPIPSGLLLRTTAGAMFPKGMADFKVDAEKAAQGKQLFTSLGCGSCHATQGTQPDPKARMAAKTLGQLKPDAGCLADNVTPKLPRYSVSAAQRDALRATVADMKQPKPLDQAAKLEHAMTAFNCYACHARGTKGGPDKQRAEFFVYEILVELGDEGRLPPPLGGVGAKLTKVGFEDALFSGKRYRSYMGTRMPNFGPANVGHLPDLFKQADAGLIAAHEPAFNKKMVDDGRQLSGKTTLACINCHAWGSQRLPGAEGLDLLEVTRRLQPGWFQAWLINPNKIRPGTRMPTAWPDGKSFFPNLQEGDTGKQIDAIWAYLAAGQKGGAPAGLAATEKSLLTPIDETIVFRTFLDQVGAHAILVGFPQKVHLAFDANRVRAVQAWSGNFITTTAAWDGRAGVYAKVPSIDLARFPDGPAFTVLDTMTTAWPADIHKAKFGSNRTPPGWRYLGYRLGDKGTPTFMYAFGPVSVEETPGVETRMDGTYLARRFTLRADEAVNNLYFRVAVGKEIIEKNGVWIVDNVQRWRVAGPAQVRVVNGVSELLTPVRFDKGISQLSVELTWQ